MTKLSKVAGEVWGVLQTINEVTGRLCELASAGEYTKVAGLLQEREHLIANAKRAHDKLMNGVEDKTEKGEVHQTLRPVMDQIRDADNRLMEILQRQKDIVLGKLQETQKQQALHAYTQ